MQKYLATHLPIVLKMAPAESAELKSPRQSRDVFDLQLSALTPESYLYRVNHVSGPMPATDDKRKFQRSYINDILRDGLLYTNNPEKTGKFLTKFYNCKSDRSFSEQILSEINTACGDGEWRCRGLYMYLTLRDCVRMQYIQANMALNGDMVHLAIITRMKRKYLLNEEIWPDVLPEDGAFAAFNVVPFSGPPAEPPGIAPDNIQIWFGGWIDLPKLNATQLRKDVEARKIDQIVFPYKRLLLEEALFSGQQWCRTAYRILHHKVSQAMMRPAQILNALESERPRKLVESRAQEENQPSSRAANPAKDAREL